MHEANCRELHVARAEQMDLHWRKKGTLPYYMYTHGLELYHKQTLVM